MRILITGGHLTPALAIIEQLKNEEIFYVGRIHSFEGDKAESLEYQQISKLKIPFIELKTGRLQRKITKYTLISLVKLPPGFLRAYKIVKQVKPDVVLTFGSYISVPIGIVAKLLNIPLIIHEQTLEAGFANKILSRFADKICISWKSSEKFFPKDKTILTGNPIRQEILDLKGNKIEANQIYISGGSSGSHAINILVESIIEKLLENFKVIHQTGDSNKYKDYDRLMNLKNTLDKKLSVNYKIVKFLDTKDAALILANSSLVIGRAGINTVTELIFLERVAYLIPLPFSQKKEQLKNAKLLTEIGLGLYSTEKSLTPQIFYEKILSIINNLDSFKLKENILLENPAKKIIKILHNVCE